MKSKSAIALLLLLSVLSVSITYAVMTVLWSRDLVVLVQLQNYTATLLPVDNMALVNLSPEATQWQRMDEHHYSMILAISEMNQIDTGILRINITDVPDYLDMAVSKVQVVYVKYSPPYYDPLVYKEILAENVPLGTEISIAKSLVILNRSWGFPETTHTGIYIELSEYQTGASGGLSSVELNTVVDLGVEF